MTVLHSNFGPSFMPNSPLQRSNYPKTYETSLKSLNMYTAGVLYSILINLMASSQNCQTSAQYKRRRQYVPHHLLSSRVIRFDENHSSNYRSTTQPPICSERNLKLIYIRLPQRFHRNSNQRLQWLSPAHKRISIIDLRGKKRKLFTIVTKQIATK